MKCGGFVLVCKHLLQFLSVNKRQLFCEEYASLHFLFLSDSVWGFYNNMFSGSARLYNIARKAFEGEWISVLQL